ncbi:unnamed protein product [Protopolystoma xenopodis]|uniref:Uncharacterized protein n=1 Tax=Protopolystoma xenopodis TaxID=117903 RepID=A0A448WXB7_9PLAT|nr:unnamed protein product [Protopolystoma xenopodis]
MCFRRPLCTPPHGFDRAVQLYPTDQTQTPLAKQWIGTHFGNTPSRPELLGLKESFCPLAVPAPLSSSATTCPNLITTLDSHSVSLSSSSPISHNLVLLDPINSHFPRDEPESFAYPKFDGQLTTTHDSEPTSKPDDWSPIDKPGTWSYLSGRSFKKIDILNEPCLDKLHQKDSVFNFYTCRLRRKTSKMTCNALLQPDSAVVHHHCLQSLLHRHNSQVSEKDNVLGLHSSSDQIKSSVSIYATRHLSKAWLGLRPVQLPLQSSTSDGLRTKAVSPTNLSFAAKRLLFEAAPKE